jgi:hypothetical protein
MNYDSINPNIVNPNSKLKLYKPQLPKSQFSTPAPLKTNLVFRSFYRLFSLTRMNDDLLYFPELSHLVDGVKAVHTQIDPVANIINFLRL